MTRRRSRNTRPGVFRLAGIDFDAAQESMKLFAAEILPELKSWDMEPATVS